MAIRNTQKRRSTVFFHLMAAGIFCLFTVDGVQAMSPPLTQHLKIINRCSHPVEAQAKQRLTRPWKKVHRRFTLVEGEQLEDSRQLAGIFGIGPRYAPPPEVSFRYQDQDVSSATVVRGGGHFIDFTIIACSGNMTDEEKNES